MKSPLVLKWVKELVGVPTYLSVIIIGMVFIDRGVLVTLACVLLAAASYNYLYDKLFPGYVINGRAVSLLLLFFGQILAWGLLFLALNK